MTSFVCRDQVHATVSFRKKEPQSPTRGVMRNISLPIVSAAGAGACSIAVQRTLSGDAWVVMLACGLFLGVLSLMAVALVLTELVAGRAMRQRRQEVRTTSSLAQVASAHTDGEEQTLNEAAERVLRRYILQMEWTLASSARSARDPQSVTDPSIIIVALPRGVQPDDEPYSRSETVETLRGAADTRQPYPEWLHLLGPLGEDGWQH